MTPQFSVIIPVHNRERLVGDTIRSVLTQGGDVEIIAVDDGSTDGSLDVLRSFGTAVRVIAQENRGPGAARNAGLEAARGQYIVFLDSDDLWLPWTLETVRAAIAQHADATVVLHHPKFFRTPEELAQVQKASHEFQVITPLLTFLAETEWVSASLITARKDVLRQVGGFNRDRVFAEDWDLLMRLGLAHAVEIRAPVTLGFRRHIGSATDDAHHSALGLNELIARERRGLFPGGSAWRSTRRQIIAKLVRATTLEWVKRGHHAVAWPLYRRTFLWHLGMGRLRYLLGFPILAACRRSCRQ